MYLSWALLFWGNCHDLCARLEIYFNSVKLSTWPITRNALHSVIFVVFISPIWISTQGGHRATYLRVGRGGEWLTAARKLNGWGRKWWEQIWSYLGLAEALGLLSPPDHQYLWRCLCSRKTLALVVTWRWYCRVHLPCFRICARNVLVPGCVSLLFHWVLLVSKLDSSRTPVWVGAQSHTPYHFKHSF